MEVIATQLGMLTDIELTSLIADDHGVGKEALGSDAHSAPFVGISAALRLSLRAHIPGMPRWTLLSGMFAKAPSGMLEPAGGYRQPPLAHIGDRLKIDRVIAVAGAALGGS